MKKILSALLVVACIFAFAACTTTPEKDKTTDVDNNGKTHTLDTIQDCIDDSAPKGAHSTVEFKSDMGTLNASYTVTYNDDGSATVECEYELFNTIDPTQGITEFKTKYTATVNVTADGVVEGDVNGVGFVEALGFDIFLDTSKISSYSISAGILKAKITASNTVDVLGVFLGYDVNLNIITSDGKVTSMAVAYLTSQGAVEIITTYNY